MHFGAAAAAAYCGGEKHRPDENGGPSFSLSSRVAAQFSFFPSQLRSGLDVRQVHLEWRCKMAKRNWQVGFIWAQDKKKGDKSISAPLIFGLLRWDVNLALRLHSMRGTKKGPPALSLFVHKQSRRSRGFWSSIY